MKSVSMKTQNIIIMSLVMMAIYFLYEVLWLGTFWDDTIHIIQNPYYQKSSVGDLLHFWSQSYFGLYIPVTYTAWGLFLVILKSVFSVPIDQSIAQLHFLNIIIQLLNCFLIYKIMVRLNVQKRMAIILSMVFLIHPLNTEVIMWIAEFRGLLCGFFGLLAVYCVINNDFSKKSLWWFTILTLLAILSKPNGVVLFALLVCWLFYKNELQKNKLWFVLSSLILSLPVLYTKLIQSGDDIEYHTSLLERMKIIFESLSFYITKIVYPADIHHIYAIKPIDIHNYFPSMNFIILILILLAGFFYRKKQTILTLIPLIILLSVNLGIVDFVFQNFSIVANRYSYFALIYAVVLFGVLKLNIRVKLIFLLPYIVLSAYSTAIQVDAWSSNEKLWEFEYRKNPKSTFVLEQWHDFSTEKLSLSYVLNNKHPSVKSQIALYSNLLDVGVYNGTLETKIMESQLGEHQDSVFTAAQSLKYYRLKDYKKSLKLYDQSISGRFRTIPACHRYFNILLHYKGRQAVLDHFHYCPFSLDSRVLSRFYKKVQNLESEFPVDIGGDETLDYKSKEILDAFRPHVTRRDFNQVVKIFKEKSDPKLIYYSKVYEILALAYLHIGNQKAFKSYYFKMNSLYPLKSENFLREVARLNFQQGKYIESYRNLIRAYVLFNSNAEYYLEKLKILRPFLTMDLPVPNQKSSIFKANKIIP